MASNVLGAAAALAALEALKGQAVDAVHAGHKTLADREADQIRSGAPEDTGRLRSTVRIETSGERTEVIVGDDSTPYLGFNEFGTRRQPPRPFVRPAAARAEAEHEAVMTSEARARIK